MQNRAQWSASRFLVWPMVKRKIKATKKARSRGEHRNSSPGRWRQVDCPKLKAGTEIRLHTEIQPTLHEMLSQSSSAAAAKTSKAWEAGVSHLYLRRLRQDCQKFEVNLVYTVRFTPVWAKPAYQYIHIHTHIYIYNLSTEGAEAGVH